MNHVFSSVPAPRIQRSVFRRNHNLKTTMGTDFLYPIYVDEALPGDTFKCKGHFFARLTTPIVPIMDNLYLDTFFFAVPVRLIDKEFKQLMGERPFGDVRNDYVAPVISSGSSGVTVGSLSDYLGIPINVPNLEFSPWWHRAYNLIFNEWFRDENLVAGRPIAGLTEDGIQNQESLSDYVLCRRSKRHDYFTSCLPWPQKGESATFSLGQHIKVQNWADNNYGNPPTDALMSPRWYSASGNPHTDGYSRSLNIGGSEGTYLGTSSVTNVSNKEYIALEAQLDASELITVNQLREAVALQHFLEREALGGCSRYIEVVYAHFNVLSPDARMQRPEYLGGSSRPLNVTSVAQTSASDGSSTPQGNLSAFVTVEDGVYWNKSFTEHCVILGIANVRADLSYQQGLPRMFSRRTKFDFYWPELANLGEQPVLNKEIYAQGASVLNADNEPIDDDVFGYQERWAEYRYHPNMITGLFRSTATNPLDVWHLAQKFDSLPTLSADFIQEHVPIERVLAVQDEPPLILDAWYELTCARPMPLYSVPGLSRL